jgi:hypothetical protein
MAHLWQRRVHILAVSRDHQNYLTALLQAVTHLVANRRFHHQWRPASYGADSPASARCSGSAKSRKLASPKTARKVWVVTKV